MARAFDRDWRTLRAFVIARDGHRCTVARLLGGSCVEPLHVHHIVPVRDGGADHPDNLATVCVAHHPVWESLRRQLSRRQEAPRCPHRHVHAEARRQCEERLARTA